MDTSKLYKQKFCIGVYETNDGESLIGLFDSTAELAKFLEVSVSCARTIVSQRAKGTREDVIFNKQRVSIVLVDMTD